MNLLREEVSLPQKMEGFLGGILLPRNRRAKSKLSASDFRFDLATRPTAPCPKPLLTSAKTGTPRSSSGTSASDFTPPEVSELNGTVPGYEFLELIGKGSSCAVYEARQLNLDRPVAIKLLPRHYLQGAPGSSAKRFEQEAQAMARLSHPNLISVYDYGKTANGELFLAMEYVEGANLQQLIRSGNLDTDHIFGWVPQICAGLHHAHRSGVVHRDIKPSNIMIGKDGSVKIGDFGLAKLTGQGWKPTKLTKAHVAMGTPDYVAPEVLEDGDNADHRTDLYAVGVILFQMLTGRIPRGTWHPPSHYQPHIDPRFDQLVSRSLHADPEARFQNALEITNQLSELWRTSQSHQTDSDAAVGPELESAPNPVKSLPQETPGTSHGKSVATTLPLRTLASLGVAALLTLGCLALSRRNDPR